MKGPEIKSLYLSWTWAVFVFTFAAAVLASGCNKKEAGTPAEKPPILVEVMEVHPESFQETVASSAVVRAHEEFRISTRVDGMLLEQKVDRGDRVKKDQILFKIESEPFDLQVRERAALLSRAEARLKFAEQEAARKETLFQNKNFSEAQWDKIQFDLASARAERDQARVAAEQAARDLRLATIRSPVDGHVLERLHETGEVLPRGTLLARVVDSSRIILEVGLSDRELSHIGLGNPIPVRIDALPDREFSGKVTQIAANASPSTGTFPVEISVWNLKFEILPGMVARLELPGESFSDRMIIPLMAVHQQLEGPVVFLVEENRAVKRPVKLGRVLGERVFVPEGLQAGDRIVLVGQGRLESGDAVEVIE